MNARLEVVGPINIFRAAQYLKSDWSSPDGVTTLQEARRMTTLQNDLIEHVGTLEQTEMQLRTAFTSLTV